MFYNTIKRIFDFGIAVILLLATCPLSVAVALGIKIEDAGKVFFFQKRVGKDRSIFQIIKFRSMVEGSENPKTSLSDEQYEKYIKEFKLDDDPRETKIGKFLRASKLDELPQMINIILGQMSIVGPRPIVPEELKNYSENEANELLEVRPGLTGYWQIHGNADISYANSKRQKMELFYVRNRSFVFDLKIIVQTVFVVVRSFVNISSISLNKCRLSAENCEDR